MTIVTILIESCASHAMSVVGPWTDGRRRSPHYECFYTYTSCDSRRHLCFPATSISRKGACDDRLDLTVHRSTTHRFIIQRVVNKSALKSNAVASRHLTSFKPTSRGRSTGSVVALPVGDSRVWWIDMGRPPASLGLWLRLRSIFIRIKSEPRPKGLQNLTRSRLLLSSEQEMFWRRR